VFCGALAASAGAYLLPQLVTAANRAAQSAKLSAAPVVDISGFHYHLAGTDGWIYFPGQVDGTFDERPQTFLPDAPARPPQNTYAFGFRDMTEVYQQYHTLHPDANAPESDAARAAKAQADRILRSQVNKVQASAPLLYAKAEQELRISLTNLGLLQRPDLTDGHSIHFHGFPNAIPVYDGVPELSVGVPMNDTFTYFYRPHDPGTYMYHCHFEDVEHVSMGMTGVVFVRPADGSQSVFGTGTNSDFDVEFPMIFTEIWAQERYRDAHIAENDWSDYEPNLFAINGRVYPDTIAPASPGIDPATGELRTYDTSDHAQELQYQPHSSLVECSVGQRVLLRLVNLGYQQQTMRVDGLQFHVVGKDAKPLRDVQAPNVDRTYYTDAIYIGPGDSFDVIFTPTNPGTYLFYNGNMSRLQNPGVSGYGGQMTHIVVH
jgi:FtsP/CotA-like multicopper oxidase with cupredoxin domain